MKATFLYAVRYNIEAICKSPFRTGNAEGDTESVLINSVTGIPMIQGTSIAGTMRSFAEKQGFGTDIIENLFGSQHTVGVLNFSDGLFTRHNSMTRPHVKINGATGAGEDKGKYNTKCIPAGEIFSFDIVMKTDKLDNEIESKIEILLGGLNSGAVCLGAQKTNGFGQVSLVVKKRVFSLVNENDRNAWLSDDISAAKIIMLPVPYNKETVFKILSVSSDSMLIKSIATGDGKNATVHMSESMSDDSKAIIPGSSLKGIIRNRINAVAQIIGIRQETVDQIFGRNSLKGSDNGIAGTVIFNEAVIKNKKFQKISRIHINRFTGGVIDRALFTETPVSGEFELTIKVQTAENLHKTACGLILFAIRDIAIGLYGIGSGNSIGRGRLNINEIQIKSADGNASLVFGDSPSVKDDLGIIKAWLDAVGG